MRFVLSALLVFTLMVSGTASSIADVKHSGLYNYIDKQAFHKNAELNTPARITKKDQVLKLISRINNQNLTQRMKKDVESISSNVNIAVDWTDEGFNVTQESFELKVNLTSKNLSFRGHDFQLESAELSYNKLREFLQKHAQKDSVTLLHILVPTAHAFEPVTIIMGVVALAIYIPMIKDLTDGACKGYREDVSEEIESLKNSCQSDVALLEEGSYPRDRFETQSRIDELKEISNLTTGKRNDDSCKQKLPDEIHCVGKDHKQYIKKTCKEVEELSSCLSKFEKISPTSINQSRKGKSRHFPIRGRPTDTFQSQGQER